jgi:hypothetical protein
LLNIKLWAAMVGKFEGTYGCLKALGELPPSFRLGVLLESHLFSGMPSAPVMSIMQERVALSAKVAGPRVVGC